MHTQVKLQPLTKGKQVSILSKSKASKLNVTFNKQTDTHTHTHTPNTNTHTVLVWSSLVSTA